MSIVYQTNKSTGTVYAYEATSVWDPKLKKPKSIRTYLGRVAPDGTIIPPVRHKKRSNSSDKDSNSPVSESIDFNEIVEKKNLQIASLTAENQRLQSTLDAIQSVLNKTAKSK